MGKKKERERESTTTTLEQISFGDGGNDRFTNILQAAEKISGRNKPWYLDSHLTGLPHRPTSVSSAPISPAAFQLAFQWDGCHCWGKAALAFVSMNEAYARHLINRPGLDCRWMKKIQPPHSSDFRKNFPPILWCPSMLRGTDGDQFKAVRTELNLFHPAHVLDFPWVRRGNPVVLHC